MIRYDKYTLITVCRSIGLLILHDKNNGLVGGVNITENNIRILIIPTIKEDTIKIDKELSETRLP